MVLTASALHARDLQRNKLSSVVFLRVNVDAFRQRYMMPLEAKALGSTKLCC